MMPQVAAVSRRIIRRPRLTSLLNESSARIRLLVAPAGYGKTTLAREWLNEPRRRDAWYLGEAASADVAALAIGIAEAAAEIVPSAGKRMRDRLRSTRKPEDDVGILAELFAEDMQRWPEDAWLVVDDYQCAMDAPASERFVCLLAQQTPIQMLITSRRRPSWAAARQVLYGEIQEIDRRALAMEDGEAKAVLCPKSGSIEELLVRARGWPAVIGLAALTAGFNLPAEDLPATLHTYFAEEVFQAADPRTRREFGALAIVPSVSHSLASFVVGEERVAEVIETGLRIGVWAEQSRNVVAIHPLLRDHLLQHCLDQPGYLAQASRIGDYLLAHSQWDNAFEVAYRASLTPLAERTIEKGLDTMLSQGRLATIQRWLDFVASSHLDSPVVDLAEAELAFREGQHETAYVLAAQAANRFPEDPDLRARAHVRAGHSALLASRERTGLDHFRSAHSSAQTPEQRREALVGLYLAASELDQPDAADAFEQLESAADHTPEGILRLEALRLARATRVGGIADALQSATPRLQLADRTNDPLGLTAFLHALATSLNLGAQYEKALNLAERQLVAAREYRLELPIVHANLNRAISHIGLRAFQRSLRTLDEVRRLLPSSGDAYLEATIRLIESRTLLARQRFSEALALTADHGERISSPPLRAEYLGVRALGLACTSETRLAQALIDQAQAIFPSSIELRVLAPCIEGVISLQKCRSVQDAAAEAWNAAQQTGNFDSLVCSYRAEPRLLSGFRTADFHGTELADLLSRTRDEILARRLGILVNDSKGKRIETLTARESEVLRELEEGSTNREIAQSLFISEATVKVHLRHIYGKFGVRTRTELLARRARQP
jgi:ATP/maltotriose-dependent transcriptional regulator MalT